MSDVVLLLTTVPTTDVGEDIARALVAGGLAACVNVLPPMVSIYHWKGVLHRDVECQVVVKTARVRVDAVREALADLHPYDLPECLVLSVEGGDPAYLAWVTAHSGEPGA
jgi:periplasmic divalent cation tolerance protein